MATDSRPLEGKRVLVTRGETQAGELVRALQGAGAQTIAVPLIAIVPPDDRQRAQHAALEAARYAWIVFTSANGVRAFFDDFRGKVEPARVAAIGDATARDLAARGVRVDLVPEEHAGEALANALLTVTKRGDRILLFRAQQARDVVPVALGREGRIVDDVAAYKTLTRRAPELEQFIEQSDVVTFASGSTVRAFVENGGVSALAARPAIVACIGPVTADAARGCGLRVDVVARTFSGAGLIDALEAHLRSC